MAKFLYLGAVATAFAWARNTVGSPGINLGRFRLIRTTGAIPFLTNDPVPVQKGFGFLFARVLSPPPTQFRTGLLCVLIRTAAQWDCTVAI